MIEPVLPMVGRPHHSSVGLLIVDGGRASLHDRVTNRVSPSFSRVRDIARGFEPEIAIGGERQHDVRVGRPADALGVAGAGVLPLATGAPEVEHGLAVEVELDLAVDASHGAGQARAPGVVVRRRAAVCLRAGFGSVPGTVRRASRTITQPVLVPQLVSSTIVPGRYRRATGTSTPSGANRKKPAPRSRTAPKRLGESKRGRHIHSMFPFGATSAPVVQSDRKAYSAMGGTGSASAAA